MPRAAAGRSPIRLARQAPPPAVHEFEEHTPMSTLSSVPTSTYLNYIGGEWGAAASRPISEDRDPPRGDLICRFQASGPEDVHRALAPAPPPLHGSPPPPPPQRRQ